jgi:hypothetical protein
MGSRTRAIRRGASSAVRHEKHNVVPVCHGTFAERRTTILKGAFRGLFKRFVGIEGPDNVDTLHFGQWEILGALLERRRY